MKKLLHTYPNLYYLLIIIACCSCSASSIGIATNCMGLFVTPIANHLEIGFGAVTMYITIMNLCSAFFAPVLAKLMIKFDIRFIMSTGIIINGIILLLFSIFNQVSLFYLFAILFGASNCCFSLIPITQIINNWFKKKQGFVSGICLSFSGVGGAIFNPIINSLIVSMGYQHAFIICAFLIVILSLPFTMFVIRLYPQQLQLLPYGADEPIVETSTKSNHDPIFKITGITAISIICYATLVSFTVGFNPNIAPFASSVPLSSQLAAAMISAAMIANILSKIILGWICDKWNAIVANAIMIVITMCGFIGIMTIHDNSGWTALLYAFLFGFIFASNAAGTPLLIKEMIGNQNYARFYSITTIFTSSAYALSVSIISFSYDLFRSYLPILCVLILLCINNLLLLLFIHKRKNTIAPLV